MAHCRNHWFLLRGIQLSFYHSESAFKAIEVPVRNPLVHFYTLCVCGADLLCSSGYKTSQSDGFTETPRVFILLLCCTDVWIVPIFRHFFLMLGFNTSSDLVIQDFHKHDVS